MCRPNPPTYKTTNWPAYNDALKRRGSLTIWFDPEMCWDAAPVSQPFLTPISNDTQPAKGRRVAAPSWTFLETETREGENGREYSVEVPYMTVNCARCGNSKRVHGHQRESYDAACVYLRDTCPKGERNYYAEP
tara:strand:- start:3345 stop:3746 length:402 start_codon:yes stop_codon:yes gene_type:complete